MVCALNAVIVVVLNGGCGLLVELIDLCVSASAGVGVGATVEKRRMCVYIYIYICVRARMLNTIHKFGFGFRMRGNTLQQSEGIADSIAGMR